ncbi:hypothetical protein O181_002147 [Austropuccinia psidii MF-1]|uniref:Uncharacterized protein n=1 Tax=Austropuccinia psidii MF-1 TaxID=1389203 RepID=A0A9Q3GDQ1_9BASI|nr:hypothetical protein [Austropuccinia psidii MF-1]
MEHGQKEVQPSFTLGRSWSRLPDNMSQRDTLKRPCGNNQRMESQQEVQNQELPSGFTPFRNWQISGNESLFFTIPGSFQEKTRIKVEKQDFFQPEEERVRPNVTEAVGICERSTKAPGIVVNTYDKISSPATTQNESSFVTPESELWLQMSQFAEQTQENFGNLHERNLMLQELINLQRTSIHTLQEGYVKLSKVSEETNKRLNQVLEEQYQCKKGQGISGSRHEKIVQFLPKKYSPKDGEMFWIILCIARKKSNQMPCLRIIHDLHHNTKMENK